MTLVVLNVQNRAEAQSENEKVVTVYDGEEEQTFVTESKTVGEALKKAGIDLNQSDAVEPAQHTVLAARNYHINVYRARPVLVEDGATRVTVVSPHKSARQVAEKAGLTLYAEDEVAMARGSDPIDEGAVAQKLTVDRATPISLKLYGKEAVARTQSTTVGELLNEKKVKLGPKDGTSLPLTAAITPGMVLEVWRDGTQTLTEEKAIPYPVEQVKDMDREQGFKEIRQPGVDGKRMVTFEISVKNGKEVSRKEIQSVVTVEATKQVEVIGMKPKFMAGPANPTGNAALGQRMMLEAGFGADQWGCLYKLWNEESGWNQYADNPGSDAYGIPQALPGSKMGPGWQSDPVVQIRWGLGYIKGRYANPCSAYAAKQAKGWY